MLKLRALLYAGCCAIVLSSLSVAQSSGTGTHNQAPLPLSSIVERMRQAEADLSQQAPYQVIRKFQLFSASSSEPTSEVLAEVNFQPAAGKAYRIERRSGSNRGEQVVRRILDHEVDESTKPAEARASALTEENYEFRYAREAAMDGHPCYVLELRPRRKDNGLIAGEAWVDESSFLVRHIAGQLAKSPSWWLKQVSVKITFSDVQGTWIQSDVEALADVRLVGRQTLRSQAVSCQSFDVVARDRSMPIQNSRGKRHSNSVPAEVFFGPRHN